MSKARITILVISIIAFILCGAALVITLQNTGEEINYDENIAKQYGPQDSIPTNSDLDNVGGEREGDSQTNNASSSESELWEVDLNTLRSENPDTVGWIWMPYTGINYPVVQAEDNDYYLTHKFDRSYSKEGAIYVDYHCESDSNNLIIYGHNTSSGKFDSLNKYLTDSNYYTEHPYFIYYDSNYPAGRIFLIYSVIKADVGDSNAINELYRIVNDADYTSFQTLLKNKSIIEAEVELDDAKQTIMLSTCCYDGAKRCLICAIDYGPL